MYQYIGIDIRVFERYSKDYYYYFHWIIYQRWAPDSPVEPEPGNRSTRSENSQFSSCGRTGKPGAISDIYPARCRLTGFRANWASVTEAILALDLGTFYLMSSSVEYVICDRYMLAYDISLLNVDTISSGAVHMP